MAKKTEPEEEPKYTIMYDLELMRPGCVILQALADIPSHIFYKYFSDSSCWLTAPTDNMKLYRTTEAELAFVAKRTKYPERKTLHVSR